MRRLLMFMFVMSLALLTSSSTRATTALIDASPGLYFIPASDPTGNGMESVEIIYRDDSGNMVHSGAYVQRHNSAGIRIVVGPAPHTSGTTFELDPSNDQIVVIQ
jgi:hypothetical protein